MHISTLHLYTYSPNELINGSLEITTESGNVKINLSEADRTKIQQICVDAYIADRQKLVDELLANTPALVALPAPSDTAEDAEFTKVKDEIPF